MMRRFSGVMMLGVVAQSFAGTMGAVDDWSWVASLSAGPTWGKTSEAQTFFLTPDIEKSYVPSGSSHTRALGELFLGVQRNVVSGGWQGRLGLDLAAASNATVKGIIWDDALVQFNNYSYQYKISNSRISLKGVLLLAEDYCVIPWVHASVGVSFNRAHGFTNTPLIFEALPNPNFTDRTTTSFVYTLGAGVQKPFNEHWQIGVGYEFVDWGKSELGRALGQTLGSGLRLNHLYNNGVLFNLTYVS